MLENSDSLSLMEQKADKEIVEKLYHNGFLTQEAKDYALELLEPHHKWHYWIAKTLTWLGYFLIWRVWYAFLPLIGNMYLYYINSPFLKSSW